MADNSALRRRLLASAFLSGAAGLIYQTVWLRMLGLAVGSTAMGVCLVLSVFMGGLALGGWLLGARTDAHAAPLRFYAGIEFCLAVCGIVVPWLFRGADTPWAAVMLLAPAALMGGTLPVLLRAMHSGAEPGRDTADLYFANTLGAALGVLVGGFLLLPELGVSLSSAAAAGLNIAAALVALSAARGMALARPVPPARPAEAGGEEVRPTSLVEERPAAVPAGGRPVPALLWAVFALTGAAGLAFEALWTRLLALIVGSTAQAFSVVLAVFLLGTALGSRLAAKWVDRLEARSGIFGLIQLGVAAAALAALAAYPSLPGLFLRAVGFLGDGPVARPLVQALLAAAVLLIPTFFMGLGFPWFTRLVDSAKARGGRFGLAYAVNTAGAATGAWAATFVLVPHLGLSSAAGALVLAYGLLGVAALALEEDARLRRAAPWALVTVLGLWSARPALPPELIHNGVFHYNAKFLRAVRDPEALRRHLFRRTLLWNEDGVHASVSVWKEPSGLRSLVINGKPEASDGADMPTQLLAGHLPAIYARAAGRRPRRALLVGMGSGVTAAALLRHPLESLDVVEIEPAVVRAAAHFAAVNRGVLNDPRLRVMVDDGRHVLRDSSGGYDAIVSEPSNPWIAGMSHLFTTEFYSLTRRRLAPGGVFCQWLQLYGMTPEAVAAGLETVRRSFPHVSAWRWKTDLLIVASEAPLTLDWDGVEALLSEPGVSEDLAPFGLRHVPELLALNVGADSMLARGGGVHTDDKPVLDYSAPLALHDLGVGAVNAAGLEAAWTPSAAWLAAPPERRRWLVRSLLAAGRAGPAEVELAGLPAAEPWRYALQRDLGELYLKEGKPAKSRQVFTAALKVRPADPRARLDLARARLAEGDRQGAVRELEAFSSAAGRTERFDAALAKARRPGGVAQAYLAMGLGYARSGEGRIAAQAFGYVLEAEPAALGEMTRRGHEALR